MQVYSWKHKVPPLPHRRILYIAVVIMWGMCHRRHCCETILRTTLGCAAIRTLPWRPSMEKIKATFFEQVIASVPPRWCALSTAWVHALAAVVLAAVVLKQLQTLIRKH